MLQRWTPPAGSLKRSCRRQSDRRFSSAGKRYSMSWAGATNPIVRPRRRVLTTPPPADMKETHGFDNPFF